MSLGLLLVFALLCVLGAVMGFRDAPNAIALPVRFRALTPRVGLLLAACLNGVGVALGMGLITLSVAFYSQPGLSGPTGRIVLDVALVVAIAWGVLLWWRRVPGSTTHALLAALAGAHLAAHVTLGLTLEKGLLDALRWEVAVGLLLSPVLAWALGRLLTGPMVRLGTTGTTVTVQHRARIALSVSAGATAVGHGIQSGQRLGVLWTVALLGAGLPQGHPLGTGAFLWAVPVFALVVALGTLGGAWRIAWTLTERLVDLDPLRAAVATAIPAVLLFVGSLLLHLPLSSTHMLTASVVGAGQTQTFASVRWPRVLRVAVWWFITPPACAGLAVLGSLALLPLAS